jgi:putative transposase
MGRRPRRLTAAHYVGRRRYFLTICTYGRRPHFVRTDIVDLARSQILRAAEATGFEITAYCFMPDHLHLVVTGGTAEVDLLRFLSLAKQRSAFEVAHAYELRLWQPGTFERVLRESEDVMNLIDYIINNPVRGGLVVSPIDWPHWGSQVYSRDGLIAALALREPPRRG